MSDSQAAEIVARTQNLLESIAAGDWDAYEKMCDTSLSCFEPEARGQLVHGMKFHQFYFDNLSHRMAVNTTMAAPHVRFPGKDVAIISYVRLQQRMGTDGTPSTGHWEETRVWEKRDGEWLHVHFHRSAAS
ncbi:MAG: DUF4440 domain-containing protein [Planctomycetaceae bacterium]|nr:DUF4440 domain-containing protein [Planctomycetaceae bacterium]MCP4464982.1 DUF4440 domain-containing protein [Planctomycetaceae bacterium]MDG1809494.1 DUF4440 domain-containing protein [Pirellulaceae bacterium]MDG2104552.1 DUF4440 domain-containing protein [Pirellulaceae bacterium]